MVTWRQRNSSPVVAASPDEEWGGQMTAEKQRLFSNLDDTLKHEKGSVIGASILIAGEQWEENY